MFYLLILLLFVTYSESRLKLVFSDEFNESSLDRNKWDAYNDTKHCGTSHLNCFSSNPGNLRLIDGTLAMTTIRQKYLNKFYTTPQLTSKKSFTYGRFELRAALPRAKMIKTTIRLKPKKDGRIDIAAHHQTEQLLYGLQKGRSFSGTATVDENLNEFNIYVLEWTPSQITWIFNGRTLETFNTTEGNVDNYNPFSNPVKIHMFMAIGGNYSNKNEYFPGQTLYEKDADEWNCSLLIFDYIRVYQNVPDYNRTQIQQNNVNSSVENDLPPKINVTSSDICIKVMSEIQPKKSSWKLIFSDEFTNETLNQNKWNIQHRSSDCEGKLENQNNNYCMTNNTRNIRLTDGVIVFQYENDKDNFTAPLITTKRQLKYGKFEIRAAVPNGEKLRSYIHLDPTERHNKDSTLSTKDGKIDILSNTKLQEFNYGIHFEFDNNKKFIGKTAEIPDSPFNFHIYTMEWTKTEIRWMFDNKHLFTASIHKELGDNYNPFDKPFKLVISLDVDRIGNPPGSLNNEVSEQWPCSFLMLDYVKIYELSDENITINNIETQNKISSYDICKESPLIMKNIAKEPAKYLVIALASIFGFVLILILVSLNIFLFLRFKKSRESPNNEQHSEKDTDIELYDEVEVGNIYSIPDCPSELTNNYAEYVYNKIGERESPTSSYLKIDEYDKNRTGSSEQCEDKYLFMNNKIL